MIKLRIIWEICSVVGASLKLIFVTNLYSNYHFLLTFRHSNWIYLFNLCVLFCQCRLCEIPTGICLFVNHTIVSKGDWLGNPANIKVENKGAVGYVGSSLTEHNPLFSLHKLWLNKLMQYFCWSITSKWLECYWTLCSVRSKKANKNL